jgi:hypothetical protein
VERYEPEISVGVFAEPVVDIVPSLGFPVVAVGLESLSLFGLVIMRPFCCRICRGPPAFTEENSTAAAEMNNRKDRILEAQVEW